MRAFEMIIRVHAESLTTVLEVLKDNADLVSLKQIDDPTITPKKTRTTRKRTGGTSRGLISQMLEPGNAITIKDLVKAFVANGYAKTSAPPAINEMIRDGKAKKLGDGVYIKA